MLDFRVGDFQHGDRSKLCIFNIHKCIFIEIQKIFSEVFCFLILRGLYIIQSHESGKFQLFRLSLHLYCTEINENDNQRIYSTVCRLSRNMRTRSVQNCGSNNVHFNKGTSKYNSLYLVNLESKTILYFF